MLNNTRIVIADDTEPILLYLEKIISKEPEFEIVGKAKNGNELVDLVVKNSPDLVITDIEMPECTGIEAIEKINKHGIKTKYMAITSNNNFIIEAEKVNLGELKIIQKPILDDNKFIQQIKDVLKNNKEDYKQETKKELKENAHKKKESLIAKVINKIFTSK